MTITVGSDKGQAANFTSIQAAIDSASPGDIVLLHPGTYKENVNVNVTNLTLISESGSPENTSIRPASNSSDVVYVNADEVTISGLNITGPSSSPSAGIHLNGVKHCRIENNQLSGNYIGNVPNVSGGDNSSTVNNSSSSTGFGIRLDFSSQNTLASNTASNSSCGIWMNSSSNNMLNGNNVSDNKVGVYLEVSNGNTLNNSTVLNNTASGINLRNSSENILKNSFVSSNKVSIVLQNSSRNLLNNNKVSDSTYGIRVYSFSNNNELTDNRVSNNKFGIHLSNSIENTLTGNTVFNCARSGINLLDSTGNILNGNRIVMNSEYGLYLLNSGYSSIYNSYLIHKNNAYSGGANKGTSLNINKAVGTNILVGFYPGGNFWAAPWEKSSINQEWIGKEGIYDEAYILSQRL